MELEKEDITLDGKKKKFYARSYVARLCQLSGKQASRLFAPGYSADAVRRYVEQSIISGRRKRIMIDLADKLEDGSPRYKVDTDQGAQRRRLYDNKLDRFCDDRDYVL